MKLLVEFTNGDQPGVRLTKAAAARAAKAPTSAAASKAARSKGGKATKFKTLGSRHRRSHCRARPCGRSAALGEARMVGITELSADET